MSDNRSDDTDHWEAGGCAHGRSQSLASLAIALQTEVLLQWVVERAAKFLREHPFIISDHR